MFICFACIYCVYYINHITIYAVYHRNTHSEMTSIHWSIFSSKHKCIQGMNHYNESLNSTRLKLCS